MNVHSQSWQFAAANHVNEGGALIQNPFLPAPSQARAWSEGFAQALTSTASPSPGDNVGPGDVDAFNQGVQAGLACQDSGIDVGLTCVAAGESSDAEELGLALHGLEAGGSLVIELAKGAFIGALGEALFSVSLLIALEAKGTQPPELVLPKIGQWIVDQLAQAGAGSLQLFLGVGVDPGAQDCEFKLTPLFLSIDQARSAVKAIGRASWIIVSWRSDASGSYMLEEDAGG